VEKVSRPVEIVCKSSTFEVIEEQGVRSLFRLPIQYSEIESTEWDHAESAVKLVCKRDIGKGELDVGQIILELAVSVEFEQELRLRFTGMLQNNPSARFPSTMYVGMFAGATKPKPFQRKRPNLSLLETGKLPSLHEMRDMAIQQHRGSYAPCENGKSRRLALAIEHVHTGKNTFEVTFFRGPARIANQWRATESIMEICGDRISFKPSRFTPEESFDFTAIKDWNVVDNDGVRNNDSGLEVDLHDGSDSVFFGVKYVRDVKHTLEHFWNKYRAGCNLPCKLGSTHGRPILTVTTLSGETKASVPPQGSSEVVDMDGQVAKTGNKMVDRKNFMDNFTGSNEPKFVPPENVAVRGHWGEVVMHQGWMLKKGGVGIGSVKNWVKRYFVLYSTSQGHFLVYYSDFTESPAYTNDQNHRNIVDLSKACFIRPGSNKTADNDTPPHSFDIVTTEREWTLCAETQENVQKWLKLLTRAVDEDVAILPDEELVFKVKPKEDPLGTLNPNDYSTNLKLSAQGVSVTSKEQDGEHEHHFWVYTDFWKWSHLKQNGKLALLLNVFADTSFQRRNEFVFRHKEAVRLSTAIEYFIEKFMSVMHVRLEIMDPSAVHGAAMVQASAAEFAKDEFNNGGAVDLLDLLDTSPPSPPAYDESIPVAQASVFDPFAAAPPVPATTAPSKANPFDSDPFGANSNPFGAPAAAPSKIALSVQQQAQHKQWMQAALFSSSGPLYDDGVMQVAIKVEIRGSQGRVTLSYRNKGNGSIRLLKATLTDSSDMLRIQAGSVSSDLAAGAAVQQVIMMECMKPAHPGPTITFSYTDGAGNTRDNTVPLPVLMPSFNEPLTLAQDEFQKKWDMLVGGGRDVAETVVPTTTVNVNQVTAAFSQALKMGLVSGAQSNSMVVGAASLKTGTLTAANEKISIGCLVRLQMDKLSGCVTVGVRTLHPAATTSTLATIKALLL
jgi:hypothetical protein